MRCEAYAICTERVCAGANFYEVYLFLVWSAYTFGAKIRQETDRAADQPNTQVSVATINILKRRQTVVNLLDLLAV